VIKCLEGKHRQLVVRMRCALAIFTNKGGAESSLQRNSGMGRVCGPKLEPARSRVEILKLVFVYACGNDMVGLSRIL
jgi:hypothetical protein